MISLALRFDTWDAVQGDLAIQTTQVTHDLSSVSLGITTVCRKTCAQRAVFLKQLTLDTQIRQIQDSKISLQSK